MTVTIASLLVTLSKLAVIVEFPPESASAKPALKPDATILTISGFDDSHVASDVIS